MSLRIETTSLSGVFRITPACYHDDRGFFMETFHLGRYVDAGITKPFVQDNYSHSIRNVLRGLHFQLRHPQAKLVSVLHGRIFDVAVDLRPASPTFGRWLGEELSAENRAQLYIPAGFAHGFCVLSDEADIFYKCSALYDPADDRGLRWNDPRLAITWPVADPLLSPKDAAHPTLDQLSAAELPQ
ncbi:MAG: dTDP-4-dehydrorhamnose 3,5-epimerase [Candidatus Marinimicrobia bacterium]|nr:dTDP-4-dehydrorhamnose 3,5-epimerase [Candidatus Neomarinimicrobiota bacterium]